MGSCYSYIHGHTQVLGQPGERIKNVADPMQQTYTDCVRDLNRNAIIMLQHHWNRINGKAA